MRYSLRNADNEHIRYQEFDVTPPVLSPLKGLTWVPDPAPVEPDPEDLVPTSCSRRQGRIALLEHGYLDAAESFFASIEDETERRRALIEYEDDTWRRENPFLQTAWAALGGTEAELDALFTYAVTL